MSAVLTSREIAEEALRKIGAYSRADTGADPEDLRIALNWLDLIMSEFSGTTRVLWLVQRPFQFPLLANVQDYNLLDEAATAGAATADFEFIVSATLVWNNGGQRRPLELLRCDQFNRRSRDSITGVPCVAYVDRLKAPTLSLYPVPTADDTYTCELSVQSFPSSTADYQNVAGVQGGLDAPGIRKSWQRWAILKLAAELGDGPVRRLSPAEIDRYKRDADIAEKKLLGFENREHDDSYRQESADAYTGHEYRNDGWSYGGPYPDYRRYY